MKTYTALLLGLSLLAPLTAQGKTARSAPDTKTHFKSARDQEDIKLETDENGSTLIHSAKELNAMFKEMSGTLQKTRTFRFMAPWTPDMKEAISESQWWDFMCGYGYGNNNTGGVNFTAAFKDSTRMLSTYKAEHKDAGDTNPSANNSTSKQTPARKSKFKHRNTPEPQETADDTKEQPQQQSDTITEEEKQALKKLDQRLKAIVSKNMTVAEKILAVHDDLVQRATYSQRLDNGQKCLNMILHDEGVCEAYARYMYLALNMLGIPCHSVVGSAGGPHAWNLVQIDNNWYHLDATWDDPICNNGKTQVLRHTYFCISDATISKSHQWNRKAYPSTPDSDFEGIVANCQTFSSLAESITQAYSDGNSSFEVRLDSYTDKAQLEKQLEQYMDSHKDIRISGYAVNDAEGKGIMLFFNRDADPDSPIATPKELSVTVPVETEESARWMFRDDSAQPDQATWDELLKSSKDAFEGFRKGATGSGF